MVCGCARVISALRLPRLLLRDGGLRGSLTLWYYISMSLFTGFADAAALAMMRGWDRGGGAMDTE